MQSVTFTERTHFDSVHLPVHLPEPESSSLAWDIFSVVCFPVGLYRFSSYLVGKHLISIAVLPSTVLDNSDYRISDAAQTLKRTGSVTSGDRTATRVSFTTEDHVTLDGVSIQTPQQSSKWLVFFGGAASRYEESMQYLMQLSQMTGLNIFNFNYRGVGESGGGSPSCIHDLFKDGRAAIRYLLTQGVRPENIVCEGHSLGGSVCLNTAHAFGLASITNSTFSTTAAVVPYALTMEQNNSIHLSVDSIMAIPLTKDLSFFGRVCFALKDLIGSPLECLLRIIYYAARFFYDLVTCNLTRALTDVICIIEALVFDTILTLTGALALITSPFTQTVHEWNVTLNNFMNREEEPFLNWIAHTTFFQWLAQTIMTFAGWQTDNVATWQELRRPRITFYAAHDELMQYPASLGPLLIERGLAGPEEVARFADSANHMTLASNPNGDLQDYKQFLETALRITYNQPLTA